MTKKITKLMLNGEEYEIREYQGGWQPGADTLLYYDFEHTNGTTETNLAITGSTYNGTYSSTPTIGTLSSGKKYFNTQASVFMGTNNNFTDVDYSNVTVSIWMDLSAETNNVPVFGNSHRGTPNGIGKIFSEYIYQYMSINQKCSVYIGADPDRGETLFGLSDLGGWGNITLVGDGTKYYVYINGVLFDDTQSSGGGTTNNTPFYVGTAKDWSYAVPSKGIANCKFGSVIIEDKQWSAQEVSDYYNQTKGDYGIS